MKVIFTRDLDLLQKEIDAYPSESDLWVVKSDIRNSAGNLALHIAGNLQHFVGAILGNTGYQRDRLAEFNLRYVPKAQLTEEILAAKMAVADTLAKFTETDLEKSYPKPFLKDAPEDMGFNLMHLAVHLNYHLGQINYHRRLLAAG